jgi:hypothetical protein
MVSLAYRLFIHFYEMNLSHIRSDRQMKASIGFSIADWKKLSILFEEHHQGIYGMSLEEKFTNLGKKPVLANGEAVVFFVLFQLKNSLSYDVLGAIFGTNASNAQRIFGQYLPFIRTILAKLSLLPARAFELSDWKQTVEQEIYIDTTEIPIQRPKDQKDQKDAYSGKKKAYAKKHRDGS